METLSAVFAAGLAFEVLTVVLAIGAILVIVRPKFKPIKREARMKALSAVLVMGFALVLTTGTALGSEYERRGGKEYEHHERYESKIYGTVSKIPEGGIGTWVVNGKEVLVTKDTFIEEEHGKAAVGAYVEVKGSYDGKIFTAYKIEVKRAKR
jgi:hypothetical protein